MNTRLWAIYWKNVKNWRLACRMTREAGAAAEPSVHADGVDVYAINLTSEMKAHALEHAIRAAGIPEGSVYSYGPEGEK
jgi:hypothetical protein